MTSYIGGCTTTMKKLTILSILLILISSIFAAGVTAQTPQVTIDPTNPALTDSVTGLVDGFIQTDYQYLWRVNPGAGNSGAVVSTANPVSVSALGAQAGDVISLEVRWVIPGVFDTQIGSVAQTTVQGTPQPPTGPFTVTIDPNQPETTDQLTCLVNGFNQTDFQYLWSINGGNVVSTLNPLPSSNTDFDDVVTCEVRWTAPGLTPIAIGQATVTVAPQVQANQAPTVDLRIGNPSGNYIAGNPVNFVAIPQDADGDAVIMTIDFGDGTPGHIDQISSNDLGTAHAEDHVFIVPGTYTVTATVNDGQATGTDTVTVTILNDQFNVATLSTHSDSSFNNPATNFFRGNGLYANFFVTDRDTGAAVTGLTVEANLQHPDGSSTPLAAYSGPLAASGMMSLQQITNGEKEETCMMMGMCFGDSADGNYYYYIDALSLQDNVLGQNTLLVVTIRGMDGGIAQTTVEVLNNPPEIGEQGILRLNPIPDQQFDPGQTVQVALDNYANDVEDADSALTWTVSGNTLVDVQIDPSTRVASFTGNIDATELVTFTLEDTDGGVDTQTVQVIVGSGSTAAPVAVITADRTNARIGQVISFDGSQSTDSDGTIVNYEWDFGNGNTASGNNLVGVTQSYAALGVYTVTLTVTDDDGLRGSATLDLEITETGPRPEDNEGRQRRFAFKNIDTHDYKIVSVKALPFPEYEDGHPTFEEGDFVQLQIKFKNEGNVDERLQIKVDMLSVNGQSRLAVPTLVANQRIDVGDVRLNNNIHFVVPEGAEEGLYVAKIEVLNKGGDHVVKYWPFTVQ